MNQNEEAQNPKLSSEDLPKAEESQHAQITAADAATDLKPRLTPYEQWQSDYDHLLFDGTYSQGTYIRMASNGEIEYGIQPRFGYMSGGQLVIGYRARVSYVVKPLESEASTPTAAPASPEEADAKVAKLYSFLHANDGAGNPWGNESPSRLSLSGYYKLPMKVGDSNMLPRFLALVDNGLIELLIERLPVPAGGWSTSDLRAFKQCLLDYLRLSANQFGLFKEVKVTENLWDLDSVAGELDEELVQFLSGNGGEQGGSHGTTSED